MARIVVVDTVEIFLVADRMITMTIAALPDDPELVEPVFATESAPRPVIDVLAHLARDEAWIPSQLAGETMAEAGPTRFDGDLLGDSPASAFALLATRAREAASRVTDAGGTVHCSFGDCSVEEYLWQLIVARTLGAEALARAGRLEAPVGESLAEAVLAGLAPRAELWRTVGILLPATCVSASASARDRLLGECGLRWF